MARVYALPGVKPWVKQAANEVGNRFAVDTIYGVGYRPNASDHPKGLALDYMIGKDLSKGDQIAAYLLQNAAIYNITYLIWKQRIWKADEASKGWQAMEDRGSPTANHYDHVHASFKANITIRETGNGILPDIPNPLDDVKKTLEGIKAAIDFATDSHNWLRVGMFAGGVALMLVALVLFSQGAGLGLAPTKAAKAVRKAVK